MQYVFKKKKHAIDYSRKSKIKFPKNYSFFFKKKKSTLTVQILKSYPAQKRK